MSTIRSVASIFLVAVIVLGADVVFGQAASTGSEPALSLSKGQAYPNKPIRIVTVQIGGGNDLVARLIAQGISGPLRQQVIVENRATVVMAETVARALPDGYTLLLSGDILWVGPLLRDEKSRAKQPVPIRDFSPISMLGSSPSVFVVHPTFPAKSIKELIALAKAKPGELNFGMSVPGASNHLGMEMFKTMAGVNLVGIPYNGGGAIAAGLIANEVHMAIISAGGVMQHVTSGRLRALAVTSLKPSVMVPGVPTVAESGVPGYELIGIDAMYAPAKTPVAVINLLNQEIVRFLNTAEAKEKYLALGAEVIASSPKEHAEKIKSQMASMEKVIKAAGIKLD